MVPDSSVGQRVGGTGGAMKSDTDCFNEAMQEWCKQHSGQSFYDLTTNDQSVIIKRAQQIKDESRAELNE